MEDDFSSAIGNALNAPPPEPEPQPPKTAGQQMFIDKLMQNQPAKHSDPNAFIRFLRMISPPSPAEPAQAYFYSGVRG